MKYPETIKICHDDQLAMHIGRTIDGAQFFLTKPFIPPSAHERGSQFIALYLFDKNGIFMGAKIDNLGPREFINTDEADAKYELFWNRLNQPTFCDIEVCAFEIEQYGVSFGLIATKTESTSLVFQPGNYMSFSSPWDGHYQR